MRVIMVQNGLPNKLIIKLLTIFILYGCYRKNSWEPPPAATVLMSSCGACRVMPEIVASNTCSYCPAYRLTSVDVPVQTNPSTVSSLMSVQH